MGEGVGMVEEGRVGVNEGQRRGGGGAEEGRRRWRRVEERRRRVEDGLKGFVVPDCLLEGWSFFLCGWQSKSRWAATSSMVTMFFCLVFFSRKS